MVTNPLKYTWHPTKLDENDTPTRLDWTGFDNGEYIGRVRKETNGPTKDLWLWAGGYSKSLKGSPPTPNTGYVDSGAKAMGKVEEYWDRAREQMTPR